MPENVSLAEQLCNKLPSSAIHPLKNHKYTDSMGGYSLPANTNINFAAVLALECGRQMQIAAQRQPNKLNKSLGEPVKNCNGPRFSRPYVINLRERGKCRRERERESSDWQILNMAVGYKLRCSERPTGLTWLGIIYAQTEYILPTLYA